jgi:hypothetical protein
MARSRLERRLVRAAYPAGDGAAAEAGVQHTSVRAFEGVVDASSSASA